MKTQFKTSQHAANQLNQLFELHTDEIWNELEDEALTGQEKNQAHMDAVVLALLELDAELLDGELKREFIKSIQKQDAASEAVYETDREMSEWFRNQ